ncbi:hypothetical protein Slin15195_G068890 [Septoria linicola]|uniref:Uncharacterized protein n=1 Tax=Septoria linicola TaxID=215465 RepID=A0A9Q9AR44_9PEZI|nr:hypothetical protein Slin15195_G068890 [Septoria linicola]
MDVKHWSNDDPQTNFTTSLLESNIIRPSPQQIQDHDKDSEICGDHIPTLRNLRSTRITKEQPDYMALHRGQVVGLDQPHGKGIMLYQEKLPDTNAQNHMSHELLRASLPKLALGPNRITTSSMGSGKSTRASSIFTSEVATLATSMTDGDSSSRAVVLKVRNKDELQQIISLPPSPKPTKIVVLPLGPGQSSEATEIMAQAPQPSLNQPLSQSSELSLLQRPERKRAAPARFAGDDLVSTKRQRY